LSAKRRRWLRERAVENAAEVEKACGAISAGSFFLLMTLPHTNSRLDADDDEWQGITYASNLINSGDSARHEEYEDEETFATVTVVEEFDPGTMINTHPPHLGFSADFNSGPASITSSPSHARQGVKHRKIRYETKQARQKERVKQRARRTEKAELAGGKAARHRDTGKHRR